MRSMVLLLLLLVESSWSAHILAILPFPSSSHWAISETISQKLAERGHHITMVAPHLQNHISTNNTNYQEIFFTFKRNKTLGQEGMFSYYKRSVFHKLANLWSMGSDICEQALSSSNVQQLINSKDLHFDLILLQNFVSDCFLGFAHKFHAPIVQIMAMRSTTWLGEYVGTPNYFAHVPDWSLGYSQHMTLAQRTINTIVGLFTMLGRSWYYRPQQEAIMNNYFSNCCSPLPSLEELEAQTSLILVNSHISLGYPQPTTPNWIEVGGLHLDATHSNNKLNPELQQFLDEAPEGVIYFSFGSLLRTVQMPIEKQQVFMTVFSSLKQRVVIKWESDIIPKNISSNLVFRKWLPQPLVLAHPNTRLFVTQGGMLSLQEAMYHGVPVVGMPIFGDQNSNMKLVEDAGCGIVIDYNKISIDYVTAAFHEVLNHHSYQENAHRKSRLFKDRPMKPLEEAIFWTEYVIRHKGATHMQSSVFNLAWYQYFLLDVFAVIVFMLCFGLLIIGLIFKTLHKMLFSNELKECVKYKIW